MLCEYGGLYRQVCVYVQVYDVRGEMWYVRGETKMGIEGERKER